MTITSNVVCTFNSIDHVEDLSKSCQEVKRVLKSGGLLLLLVDIQPKPTATEPQVIPWDFINREFPDMEVITEDQFEKLEKGMYNSIKSKVPFDTINPAKRDGILLAKLKKK